MTQLEFSDLPPVLFHDIAPNVVEKFVEYHKANPHIFELFKRFAIEAKRAGRTHFNATAIFERIRWYTSVETQGDEFKINNTYRSCYSRLLAFEDPSFNEFFEFRRSKAAA